MNTKYVVFTDGAFNQVHMKGASAFFIRTDDVFICMKSYVFNDIQDITRAETVAICAAAEYLIENIKFEEGDSVTFVTDSMNSKEFLNNIRDRRTSNRWFKDHKIKIAVQTLMELEDICHWEIEWFKSHQEYNNGNKVADRLAKYALRSACEG